MGNTGSCVGRSSDAPKSKDGQPATKHGIPLPPGKPQAESVTETSILIAWDKPTNDGGSEIFAYTVKMCRMEATAWKKLTADCEGLSFEAKNLEPASGYKFFVQAENDNGVSKPSEITEVTTNEIKVEPPGDENENQAQDVKAEFGESAEKYVKHDSDDEKKSSDGEKDSDAKDGEKKDIDDDNQSDKESDKESDKKSSSSSSSNEEDKEKKDAKDSDHSDEKVSSDAIATGVSNQSEFAATSEDVGNGSCPGPLLYQYSNDSLLDEEAMAGGGETCQRWTVTADKSSAPNYPHFMNVEDVPAVNIHTSFTTNEEEYKTISDEIPEHHRRELLAMGYDLDDMDGNRLSIISERSTEGSVGSPDAQSANEHHFTFVKKASEKCRSVEEGVEGTSRNENQQKTTRITGVAMSTVVVPDDGNVVKMTETRIPMKSTSSVQKTQKVVTKTTEVKVVANPTPVSKLRTPSPIAKTGIPTFGGSSAAQTTPEAQGRTSPPATVTEPRRSSIPTLAAKGDLKTQTSTTSSTSSRRGSGGSSGKSGLPVRNDSSGSLKRETSADSMDSGSGSEKTGIPTVRRQSSGSDSPKSATSPQVAVNSRIPSFGKSGIPSPKVHLPATS